MIALQERLDPALIVHELVRVTQFRLLGVPGFARLYVHGFLKTRSYDEIPLERCACELEARFMLSEDLFSVEDAVRSRINAEFFNGGTGALGL